MSDHIGAIGDWLIASALGCIGWVMSTFTKRHIESMDRLAARMDRIGDDVSRMQGDIRVLVERQDQADDRLEKLEDRK